MTWTADISWVFFCFLMFHAVGLYTGFLIWAPYRGKMFMTERCGDCNGSGFELHMHNHVTDCKSCGGCGHVRKKDFMRNICHALLKWTDI